MSDPSPQFTSTDSLDALAADLQAMRESAGMSYRSLAAAIAAQRQADGMSHAAAQIAHTTVADVFRTGRARINTDLVVEIVCVLGGDGDQWRARCIRAMRARNVQQHPRATDSADTDAAVLDRASGVEPPARRSAVIAVVVIGALLLNSTGRFLNPLLGDVFFFDMVGTAIAALLLGPWWAALVGVLFVTVELLKGDFGGALFALTMITAGLVWGFGARRGLAATLPRFLGLSAVVACVTTAIAVPITVVYFGGNPGRGYEGVLAWATELIDVWAAVSVTNIIVSILDKVLTGAIAYFIARALVRGWGPLYATRSP